MKKVILIFALVVAYGITNSNVTAKVTNAEKSKIEVVSADADSSNILLNDEDKDKKKETKKAATSTCCGGK
jgi:phenylpyruvate tautomerase PptA (4-oxalocrotonate tautomerase family)